MPDLIYNVKLNLDKGSLGKIVEPSAEREVKDLQQQVRQLEEALERAGNESGNFNKKFKGTTKQAGANNKAFASTNQILFSFSDGVQDAAQFSQGLAQGMRAIGNNVGFTAELFANLVTRVKDYNDNLTEVEIAQGKTKTVTSELKDSFFSAGGALLTLNAALTIGQFIFNQFGKSAKEASGSVDDFISSSAELRAISDFDFLNIESLERQQDALNLLLPDIEALDKATNGLQRNNTILGRSYGLAASSAIGANEALVDQAEITQKLRDEFSGLTEIELKDLIDRVKDLNKELTLRRALFERDPLAKFIDAQARATQQTLLFVDAGLRSNEFLDKRREELEKLIQAEIDNGLTTDESKAKYIELNKQLDAVNGVIKEYNAELDEQAEKDRKLAEEKTKVIREIDKQNASIASLNASLTFGDATSKAIELSNNYQITIDELTQKMDDAKDSAKAYYQELIDGEADLTQLRGTQLLTDTLESFKPEGLINQFDSLIMRQSDAITSLATMLEAGIIDEETYRNAILRLQGFVNTQESILVSQTVGAVAKAAGAFGELFGASKEFRIAMAVADGAAAVVSTFASVPFPANLAAAASIAAQVAQQIKTIRNAEIGGSGSVSVNQVSKPSSPNFIERTGEENLPISGSLIGASQNTSSFLPKASQFQQQQMEVVVVNTFNESTVAEVSRIGGTRLRSTQVSA